MNKCDVVEKIWIYEFKDNDTHIGATLFRGTINEFRDKIDEFGVFEFPRLRDDWRWVTELITE